MRAQEPLEIVTQYAPLRAVLSLARGVAPSTPVVIRGERGTGKSLLARSIRGMPRRSANVLEVSSDASPGARRDSDDALLIELPPLRARVVDIPLLVDHFARARCAKSVPISAAQIDCLERYSWPGNVAELRRVVERGTPFSPYYIVCGFW